MPSGHYILVIDRTVHRGVPQADIDAIDAAVAAKAAHITFRSNGGVQHAWIAGVSLGWYEEMDAPELG